MDEKRKLKAWVWWIFAAMVFVLYPLSFGPAVALVENGYLPDSRGDLLESLYIPVILVIDIGPEPIHHAVEQYVEWWEQVIP